MGERSVRFREGGFLCTFAEDFEEVLVFKNGID
jgi:hypothetical protein